MLNEKIKKNCTYASAKTEFGSAVFLVAAPFLLFLDGAGAAAAFAFVAAAGDPPVVALVGAFFLSLTAAFPFSATIIGSLSFLSLILISSTLSSTVFAVTVAAPFFAIFF